MNILYLGKTTGSYIEFSITSNNNDNFFSFEKILEHVYKDFISFGTQSKEFPSHLLESMTDEDIDTILMASFSKKHAQILRDSLFILNTADKSLYQTSKSSTSSLYKIEAKGFKEFLLFDINDPNNTIIEDKKNLKKLFQK